MIRKIEWEPGEIFRKFLSSPYFILSLFWIWGLYRSQIVKYTSIWALFFSVSTFAVVLPAQAQESARQIVSTEGGTLDIALTPAPAPPQPGGITKLGIEFINKETGEINTHINYSVAIEKDGNEIFATDHLHTSEGTVTVPFEFEEVGKYDVVVILEGAMFMPLEPEEARFALSVGEAQEPPPPGKDDVATETEGPAASIPDWVKQTAAWWGKGEISNTEFAAGIQFMIEQGLITVNARTNEESASDVEIPDWVKENAVWWSEGMISDQDFARGIEFLVEKGIVSVQ